ncbi:ABC transporter permease subunit [Mesorhizobium sp. M7D.F.Ca.US.004.03.1.1]|uniref:amino acid ABC transporter permease n=1 Tax=Mesorhizobium sp. M7D.F.Ca.US.004.03.1.1 TaxID=2496702 RepID=UPI000FC99819|nr:ABC transporter permease subunit [Mesorhizobium sp. M7D.F.Ca.US.004.03.1.1]RVA14786.1 ABC transporter permease subunit [Mesorhizobium sp. M7D.F.Ca.US.004.03.1.1]
MEAVRNFLPLLIDAAVLTSWMFAVISAVSLVLALAVALAERFFMPSLGYVAVVYSWILRSVPELIVLLACYLALPQVGVALSPVPAAIVGFVLVRSAYDYELLRGALNAIDRGQIEACRALGMPRRAMIWRVVLPQTARIAIAPWVSQAVGALKGMSLASAISVSEVMNVTRQGIVATGKPFEFIFAAALLYGLISSVLLVLETYLERRTNYLAGQNAALSA